MDLLHGNFVKTIEEAEIAIKQYSKEHYFIGPRRIKKSLFIGNRPLTNKKNVIRQESSPMNKKMVFVGISDK